MTAPSQPLETAYPVQLSAQDIRALIPHRDAMFFLQQATIWSAEHFEGVACWQADNPILQGHFPGCPIVPGAIILEAAAQLAGACLLAGDPSTRNIASGHIGMLGAVRKCSFKRPVLPGDALRIVLKSRRMAEKAVLVHGTADVQGTEAAALEFMVVHAPESSLLDVIAPQALAQLLRPA